jgi:hAT family C-terminal dimerisation region
MKAVDRQPFFNAIIGKARNIVRNMRVSSVASQKPISKCGKTVVTDCPTRWSSILLMLNRLFLCAKDYIVRQVRAPSRHRPSDHQSVQLDDTDTSVEDQSIPLPIKRFKFLSKNIKVPSSAEISASTDEVELVRYKTQVESGKSTSAFKSDGPCSTSLTILFWQQNETVYPSLTPLALDLVSMPASEAYAERVFSVCGDLYAGKRNRFSENMERRVFLKMNYKALSVV